MLNDQTRLHRLGGCHATWRGAMVAYAEHFSMHIRTKAESKKQISKMMINSVKTPRYLLSLLSRLQTMNTHIQHFE
jgi:hypothetical protein